jgi:thymidylate synthase ThyX
MQVQDLSHVSRPLASGGEVLILNTGALIGAESEAMLQALHSRSIGGIHAHLGKLAKSGPEKFMSTFYVGYGHKSIGDCGSVTMFIEGVSMLAAKAIQDFMLYNGQEASTRYIDFATQKFLDPLGAPDSSGISENWRGFYLKGLAAAKRALFERHPRQDGEKEEPYQKAVNARSFDIMRGFLPAGATTNLAWHGELRHVSDHLDRLRHHPLAEVRGVALSLEDALAEAYPSSFQKKRYADTEAFLEYWMTGEYYFDEPPSAYPVVKTAVGNFSGIDENLLRKHRKLLEKRPEQTELPKFLAECGTARFNYLLDFGSFRDDQRHRAVAQRMPLLTPRYGIGSWYFNQLPDDFRDQALEFCDLQLGRIRNLDCDDTVKQYYLPMGAMVACQKVGDLPALAYFVERRARLDVHPTMRKVAQEIGTLLLEKYRRYGLKLYMETEGDRFYYKRGLQDITERPAASA